MPFKFESLRIWHLAMDLAEEAHELTKKFPKEERFNLTDQFNRASDSIALNISEGSIGQSNLEQKKYLGYSIRSIAECITCIYKAKRRSYISNAEFDSFYRNSEILLGMTISFKSGIK